MDNHSQSNKNEGKRIRSGRVEAITIWQFPVVGVATNYLLSFNFFARKTILGEIAPLLWRSGAEAYTHKKRIN